MFFVLFVNPRIVCIVFKTLRHVAVSPPLFPSLSPPLRVPPFAAPKACKGGAWCTTASAIGRSRTAPARALRPRQEGGGELPRADVHDLLPVLPHSRTSQSLAGPAVQGHDLENGVQQTSNTPNSYSFHFHFILHVRIGGVGGRLLLCVCFWD